MKNTSKAQPQYRGNSVRLTVALPLAAFEAIDTASEEFQMSWRQLCQKALRDFAAQLPKSGG